MQRQMARNSVRGLRACALAAYTIISCPHARPISQPFPQKQNYSIPDTCFKSSDNSTNRDHSGSSSKSLVRPMNVRKMLRA